MKTVNMKSSISSEWCFVMPYEMQHTCTYHNQR